MPWPYSHGPNETPMADDAPVFLGVAYVADNVVIVSQIGTDEAPATVADLKAALGASTLTTCDRAWRGQVLPHVNGEPNVGPLLEDV